MMANELDYSHPVDAETTGGEGVLDGESNSQRTIMLFDTSVLVADPEAMGEYPGCDIVVPLTVIEELDGLKTRHDDVGRSARAVLRHIEDMRLRHGDVRQPIDVGKGATFRVEPNRVHLTELEEFGLDPRRADNRILAAALGQRLLGPVHVVSQDAALRIKAAQLDLSAHEHHRGVRPDDVVPGWTTINTSAALISALYHEHELSFAEIAGVDDSISGAPALQGLAHNQCAVLKAGSASVLVRRHEWGIQALDTSQTAWGLKPRNKEQRFALDLLMDPDVSVVVLGGQAGTGKTILALAAALEQVFEADSRYDRIVILRPIISVGRQDLGYLPGSVEEKLGPWMDAIVDCVVALGENVSYKQAREMLAGWVDEGRLAMESVTYLRGRSLQSTFVLVDEAQNMEALTAKTILTRLGAGSKAVLVGDTTQIDSPFLSARTCAISSVIDKLGDHTLFGHLTLVKGERSAVADLAAERM